MFQWNDPHRKDGTLREEHIAKSPAVRRSFRRNGKASETLVEVRVCFSINTRIGLYKCNVHVCIEWICELTGKISFWDDNDIHEDAHQSQ